MKFSGREDIEAPAEAVFAALSDFGAFERAALRRGAEVTRLDRLVHPDIGMTWDTRFTHRGRARRVVLDMRQYDPPNALAVAGESAAFRMMLVLSLVELSRRRTRLVVEFEVWPRTLAARLMLQSLKLGKAGLTRRFRKRLAAFAAEIERRQGRA